MKNVTMTNAVIIPFYKSNENAPTEIIRVNKNEQYGTNYISFNIKTPMYDDASNKANIFQVCTIETKDDERVETIKKELTENTILQIEGYETRKKGTNNKYYNNVRVNKYVLISSNHEQDNANDAAPISDDDLPF